MNNCFCVPTYKRPKLAISISRWLKESGPVLLGIQDHQDYIDISRDLKDTVSYVQSDVGVGKVRHALTREAIEGGYDVLIHSDDDVSYHSGSMDDYLKLFDDLNVVGCNRVGDLFAYHIFKNRPLQSVVKVNLVCSFWGVRKEVIGKVGNFCKDMTYREDQEFLLRAMVATDLYITNILNVNHRQHKPGGFNASVGCDEKTIRQWLQNERIEKIDLLQERLGAISRQTRTGRTIVNARKLDNVRRLFSEGLVAVDENGIRILEGVSS